MFSPEFMNYIIDPKSSSNSPFRGTIPPVNQEQTQKTRQDVIGVKNTTDAFIKSTSNTLDNLKNTVNTYDKLTLSTKKEDKKPVPTPALAVLSAVPGLRRIPGEIDAFKSGDPIKAIGRLFLMLINLDEDLRDYRTIPRALTSKTGIIDKELIGTQLKFSFFRGTVLQPLIEKFKLRDFTRKIDKTLIDFEPIRNLLYKLDKSFMAETPVQKFKDLEGTVFRKWFENCKDTPYSYLKFKGKALTQIAAKSLARIPVLNIAFTSLLEIPSIVKAFKNGDGGQQIGRSAVNVAALTGGSAITGALLSHLAGGAGTTAGAALSVIGLGLGLWLGSIAGNKAGNMIFGKSIDQQKRELSQEKIQQPT